MMRDNAKKPALRFAGFDGDWELRKLGELGSIMTGSTPSTAVSDYYAEDGMLWVTPTDISENITYKTEKKLSELGQAAGRIAPKNTILVTCIASIGKNTMLGDTGSFNQQINGLTSDERKYDPYFLLTESALWSAQMKRSAAAGTMQIVNRTEFSEMQTWVPNLQEQQKIGHYFEQFDHLISLHQRKYAKLVNIKKAMLEKMFPQNGSTVPEIRFAGFTGDWERRKLGELYAANNERNQGQFPVERTISISTMTFNEKGNGADVSSLANYKVLRVGDIAYEGHTNKEFRYGRFVLNDLEDGIMSPRFSTLRPIVEQDYSFWKYYIHSEKIMRPKLVCATKAGTMMNELVFNDFANQSILVPKVDEQSVIGRFLVTLDHLITLHQRKLDRLHNIKKACLEKMFV